MNAFESYFKREEVKEEPCEEVPKVKKTGASKINKIVKNKTVNKKKKKEKKRVEVISVEFPMTRELTRVNGNRFFIRIKYKQNKDVKHKTIYFGNTKKEYYIDHKNEDKRLKALQYYRKEYNPFESKFWEKNLLNNCDAISPESMEQIFLYLYKQIVGKYFMIES